MTEAPLIDTHVHVWSPDVLRYPWLDDAPALNRPALPPAIDRASGAAGMLHVQADCEPNQATAEIAWVRGLDWPELVGIIAYADLDNEPHLIAEWASAAASMANRAVAPVVGVRHILRGRSDDSLRALAPAFVDLGDAGLVFDATIESKQLGALAVAHARASQVTLVLDHLGAPPLHADWTSREADAWRAGLRAMSEHPRAVLKVSGLPPDTRRGEAWTHTQRFVRYGLAAFGPQRTILGSDWPVTAPAPSDGIPWQRTLDAALSDDLVALDLVRSGTAIAVYGLKQTFPPGKSITA